ncbi:hypothetical protein WICMUC_000433 [Wickerhamomyces mucosus]|uniref:Major facilitator superfamily (MFS) profile domain-containing protein n=1 Tax=Wickerhamomyces mucosus TaxID=1378264 RepID=A0A9P8PXC1_9ASCO|nr:hypothetical protein WICMUC_000433 [Wickerhamomyces mucosus]
MTTSITNNSNPIEFDKNNSNQSKIISQNSLDKEKNEENLVTITHQIINDQDQDQDQDHDQDKEEIYFAGDNYSSLRKNLIVLICSIACFLAPMSSMAFLPAVSIIAKRFNTTGTIIDLSNAIYCIVMAISPPILNPLCNIYGRRNSFLFFLTLFIVVTAITAVSQNLTMFFIFRALSALFGTSFFGSSALIISDLYKPIERGTANGWTLLGSQIGPTLGPVLGGIIVTYYDWRFIFWLQVIIAGINLIFAIIFLPETLSNKFDKNSIKYNPFKMLKIFKYKNLILAGIISSSIHFSMYSLLTPITYVVNPRFNLNTPVLGSLFYLAPGSGYIVGALFGGRYADYTVKKYIVKRNGIRIPEDRLHSMIIGYCILLPITILIYGWTLQEKKGGIALPVIAMFFNGVAQTFCYTSNNTYCIDCMPEHMKSDSIGSNYFIRFIFAAIGTGTVLKEVETIGIGWSTTISAIFLMIGSISLIWLMKFGHKYRPQN